MKYCIGLAVLCVFALSIARISLVKALKERLAVLAYFKMHYLIGGIIIGVTFPSTHSELLERMIGPAIVFCLVWIGLFYGSHIELRIHGSITRKSALVHIAGPLIIFGFFFLTGLFYNYGVHAGKKYLDTVFFLSLLCMITLFRRHQADAADNADRLYPVMFDLPPARNLLPVIVFTLGCSILYSAGKPNPYGVVNSALTIAAIHAFIGLASGIVVSMLVSGATNREATIIVLIAVAAITGGIADSFLASPMLTGIIAGGFLINATTKRLQVIDAIFSAQNTVEKVFLTLAGYLIAVQIVQSPIQAVYLACVALVISLLRVLIKNGFARIWVNHFHAYNKGSRLLWAALSGQGIVSAGLAAEYMLRRQDIPQIAILFFSVIIVSQAATAVIIKDRY